MPATRRITSRYRTFQARYRVAYAGSLRQHVGHRTPAELANEAEDLLTGNKSAVYKLGRRAEWIRGNLARVLRHFGAGADTAAWRLLPVVVTSRNLLSPRVVQPEIPVVRIADLPSWVCGHRIPRRGQHRPRKAR